METVALDFDGVIADHEPKKARVLKDLYNWNDSYLAFDKFQLLTYSLQDYLGLSKSEYSELQEKIFNDLSDVIPIKGAIDGITSLKNLGYNLYIVTYRKERSEIPKWLEYYGIYIPVIYPNLGDDVPSVDYMLDDTPSKLADLDSKINIQSYLLSSPKNQGSLDLNSRFTRASDWKDFLKSLELSRSNLVQSKV